VTTLDAIFWNAEQRRPRAVVRIFAYVAFWRGGSVLLDLTLIPPLSALYHQVALPPAPWLGRALHFLLYMVAVGLATWIAVRWLDRRPRGRQRADLGLAPSPGWWAEVGSGLLLGLVLMALVFALHWVEGWIVVTGFFSVHIRELPFPLALLGPALAFTAIGVGEEVVFRGYILRNAAEGLRGLTGHGPRGETWAVFAAWVLSSLLFGLYHIFNPASSWISTVNLFLVGMLFGLPVVLTGRLGLAIGLHIAWNFAQGTIFGFPVSGNEFGSVAFIVTERRGPALWTGGEFGPEAGLVGLLAIVVGSLLILAWVQRRGPVRIESSWATYEET
jgi:uncharacterized protein